MCVRVRVHTCVRACVCAQWGGLRPLWSVFTTVGSLNFIFSLHILYLLALLIFDLLFSKNMDIYFVIMISFMKFRTFELTNLSKYVHFFSLAFRLSNFFLTWHLFIFIHLVFVVP